MTITIAAMNVLRFLLLASQVLLIFGKLIVIRKPTSYQQRELICFSEDDGAALVWNGAISKESFKLKSNQSRFYEVDESQLDKNNVDIDCKINKGENCYKTWTKENWRITNSFKTPLGPVFDQRWEDFQEFGNFNMNYDLVSLENTTAFSISVRAMTTDLQILLCNDTDYTKNFCYWILIGGWGNMKSAVRKCAKGVPKPGRQTTDSNCELDRLSIQHEPLSATEWRTFLVMWNITTRSIFLYDALDNNVFIKYKDTEYNQYNNKLRHQTTNSNNFNHYYMFIRSADMMIYRLHNYSFLHATTADATLTSPVFSFNQTICVQLLIGLCAECEIDVTLYDEIFNRELHSLQVNGSWNAAIHGLPTWQFVTFERTLSYSGSAKFIMMTKLDSHSSNPLWAVGNIRRCPKKESFRKGILNIKENARSKVTCQKLFYNNHILQYSIVDTSLNALHYTGLDIEECPDGRIGPQCLFKCKTQDRKDCQEFSICYEKGCTCPSGFNGYYCTSPCDSNKYGYYCKQSCNFCEQAKSLKTCNKVTGACTSGCIYDENITYIPPLCKTGIRKLVPPTVDINKTNIRIKFSVEWKDEYKEPLFYSIQIIPKPNNINNDWKKIYQNMTEVIEDFKNFNSGTIYNIAYLLRICNQQICSRNIQSDWQEVETTCVPAKFDLQAEQYSLTINWKRDPEQESPCPAKWYTLKVQYKDYENTFAFNGIVSTFPFTLQQLPSYTFFIVTISHGTQTIYKQEIYTLEEPPSAVLNPKVRNLFDTNVTLTWTIPSETHGEIKKYIVTLEILKYLGCGDNKPNLNNVSTTYQTEDVIITINKLHPYTWYNASIVAYNAQYGSAPVNQDFTTKQSAIATEVFSNFRIQGWTLIWESPENCSTITGSIYAKIKIRSINDDAENFPIIKQTSYGKLHLSKANLTGAEQYVARVYVIRKSNATENPSAYQEIDFTTPSGTPPKVNNLDVYEVDDRQTLQLILHLRWQSPTPPLNGTLRTYRIQLCKELKCYYTDISLNNICNLWHNYVCGSIRISNNEKIAEWNFPTIKVATYNVDVDEPGPSSVVSWEMLINQTPEKPDNFTIMILKRGIVDLHWLHPSKTGRPLKYFNITITQLSTNLVKRMAKSRRIQRSPIEMLVKEYMPDYSRRLYLHPSTRYHISVQAVTIKNVFSKPAYKEFETPNSIQFNGVLEYVMHDSTIILNIPTVANYTKNSIIHIIVKGSLEPNSCEGYLRVPENLQTLAGVDETLVAWTAAELSIQQRDAKILFTIGDNKVYGKAKNCPLQPTESYDITVIVTENQSSHFEPIALKITIVNGKIARTPHEIWLLPVLFILIITAVAFYFYRRKRHRMIKNLMPQDEIALSQNIENYEQETKVIISNSKESLSTPSDRQSLSRATTPEILLTAIENISDNAKETTPFVKVKDFEDYVREAIQTGLLVKQYEMFVRGQTRPWDYGKLPQNKTKNRYGNLIAYDETRVMLEKLPEDPYSDYINANYITGYKKEKHYIATQGPKPNTVIDFWRMIWQENVRIICMLANVVESGKTKCEQYWPDIGKKKKYGNIVVLNAKHNVFADYCFRIFDITCGKETRKVEHLHYTAWPDHGVPLYTQSVVTYLKKLLATPPGNGSVVVHCSAGVGRTGTIILCDISLRRAAAERVVDVYAEMASLRNERANMVDNKQQYLLAHLAIMECLLSVPTTLPCNEMLVTKIKELKKQLSVQQQRLQNTAWQDEALRQTTSLSSLSERNRAKNRFPELISDKISRIYLKRYPTSDEDSDYLSGVYVDGVRLQNQYLATQLPMPSTINDFWRMIAEFKVELILMLQPPDPQDPTCCAIAPAHGEFKPTPYLNITAKETVELEYYTSQKLVLIDNSEKPSREQSVTILCLTQWKPGRNQPPPPVMTMVTLWQAAERIARGDGPTVTLCHDGVTACGLYLALSFLLERMAVERECDVCLAVRAVRRSRPDFVESLEHLEYLYDAALTYFEYFETYANFS